MVMMKMWPIKQNISEIEISVQGHKYEEGWGDHVPNKCVAPVASIIYGKGRYGVLCSVTTV